ncbi:dihydroorotase [Bordetella bronchiseptica]|uniref:dihydroorotase n=1 Tax=Bordetella bronchiseptica TaxID=518 RepID=UPI00045A1572|nr:dihydroorotase [Bordetella bronchiseptica]KCV66097.1 dihydroorotase, multifunctional complex type [Bordetella bronchiseptica 99-R-0433]
MTVRTVHIAGGRLIDPASGADARADLYLADGRIAAIGQAPAGFQAQRHIDARGLAVLPGLVDLSARVHGAGLAPLASEMQAALAGGVTRLVVPPDTDPPLDEPGRVEMLRHRAHQADQARLHPLGALTEGLRGERLTEMAALAEAGCVAFSQACMPVADTRVLWRAMQYARTFGLALWLRPLDPWMGRDGVAAAGAYASRLGLAEVPVQAETLALHTIFELQRATGARVHLMRLSSAAGVALVRAARREGLPLTCDVAAHQIHLTDVDIGFFDSRFRLDPPLRGQRDRDAIVAGLADGTIDAVCSDHRPVGDTGKLLPFAEAEAGASGLELLLSLILKWAQRERVPLARALALVTSAPAAILRAATAALPSCGELAAGAPADLCLVDLEADWIAAPAAMHSRGAHTPFAGMMLPGRVRATLVAGRTVWETPA